MAHGDGVGGRAGGLAGVGVTAADANITGALALTRRVFNRNNIQTRERAHGEVFPEIDYTLLHARTHTHTPKHDQLPLPVPYSGVEKPATPFRHPNNGALMSTIQRRIGEPV